MCTFSEIDAKELEDSSSSEDDVLSGVANV